jgi:hypothetical protein
MQQQCKNSFSTSSLSSSLSSLASSVSSTKIAAVEKNEYEQRIVDNDVILSGFPKLPNSGFVVKSLMQLFSIEQNEVKSHHQFRVKKNMFEQHFVVISFKEKTSQVKLLQGIDSMSTPLKFSQFLETPLGNFYDNTTINCRMCLSKFNIFALQELQKFKSRRLIIDIKFEGFFYHVKRNSNSKWRAVRSEDDIEKIEKYQE